MPPVTATPDTGSGVENASDSVLAGLDPEQREAALALDGPVCILAGAGTGKTRAVTHRIAYGVHSGAMNPAQVLALTFTAKAAGELRARLRGLDVGGVQARTFHSAALRQLRYFWPDAVGGELPELVASKARLVNEAVARCRLSTSTAGVRDLASEIEWAKVSQVVPDSYVAAAAAAGREPPAGFGPADVAHVYSAYEEVKRRRGVIDFEDVLLLTVGILEERATVAEQVRAQYRHLTVDEYQDVSPLQQRLLDLWLGERRSLCVVGDPRQTIYSFTGATPTFLLGFRERFPDARVVRLVRSYRSTPQVVALANKVAQGARPTAGTRPAEAVDLVAQQPAGPEPELSEHADEPAEAAAVATRIRRLVDQGVPLREIAVLFRVNAQSETYEQALASADLPYVVRGGERFFARPEVREAVLLIRAGVRTAEAAEDSGPADLVRGVLASVGWSSEPPSGSGAVRDKWESLSALVRLAEEVQARGGGPADLVTELDDRAAAQHAPAVDGVTLASLHAAKGLEWDAVFVVGLVDGTVPITHASTAEQIEEERRLLYVGVTRARRFLHLSWALARSPGGRGSRRPSRFLDGLAPGRTTSTAVRSGSTKRSRGTRSCRVCGGVLASAADRKIGRCAGCEPTYDEAVVERLREWRLEVSRALSVPAFVVFTDATLVALAEAAPADESALLAVSGIGRGKADRYGAAVLAVLAGSDDVPDVV
jgi:DNA helicase-2/ATP-dependent DNA helicase PcrA